MKRRTQCQHLFPNSVRTINLFKTILFIVFWVGPIYSKWDNKYFLWKYNSLSCWYRLECTIHLLLCILSANSPISIDWKLKSSPRNCWNSKIWLSYENYHPKTRLIHSSNVGSLTFIFWSNSFDILICLPQLYAHEILSYESRKATLWMDFNIWAFWFDKLRKERSEIRSMHVLSF